MPHPRRTSKESKNRERERERERERRLTGRSRSTRTRNAKLLCVLHFGPLTRASARWPRLARAACAGCGVLSGGEVAGALLSGLLAAGATSLSTADAGCVAGAAVATG